MNKKQTRTLLIFYLLSFYVVLQFIWWAYYLIDLNQTILSLLLESTDQVELEAEFLALHRKKMWMIAGEGAVFIAFLSVGIWKVQSNLKKESSLALLQQNFLLSVTHEIKSPIASIKLYLETLLKRNLDEEQSKSMLKKALQDGERLNALSDKILLAARIESKSEVFEKNRINLSEHVASFERQMANTIGRNHPVKFLIEDDLFVEADPQACYSILNNLFENASKYSPQGEEIEVKLFAENKLVILTVSDLGPGIPNEEKSRVFEKFYRPGNENTRTNKGTGLGLYIVSQLAQQMQVEVELKDNLPNGTTMVVKFDRK